MQTHKSLLRMTAICNIYIILTILHLHGSCVVQQQILLNTSQVPTSKVEVKRMHMDV